MHSKARQHTVDGVRQVIILLTYWPLNPVPAMKEPELITDYLSQLFNLSQMNAGAASEYSWKYH